MTIYCVGKNYAAHVREMGGAGGAEGAEPVIFLKPEAALVRAPGPLVFPAGIGSVHHEIEIVLRLGADGAPDALALGLDLTDRTRQAAAKAQGLPWATAKGFRHAAAVGPFVPLAVCPPLERLRFSLAVNGVERQRGESAAMIHPVGRLLAHLEAWFGLRAGDLVFTGTPEGVGPVLPGDRLDLRLDGVPAASATFTVQGAAPPRG